MQDQYKVYDYINNVISLADNPEDFKESNFAILVIDIQFNFQKINI